MSSGLESRIERLEEQLVPQKPLVYVLDLRGLGRISSPALTAREIAEGRRQVRQAAKAGRPFVIVTLQDDRPVLKAGPAEIPEGEQVATEGGGRDT